MLASHAILNEGENDDGGVENTSVTLFLSCLSFCRKASLILHRVEKISHYCRSLLHSTHIQSRTDTVAYIYCRSNEGRPPSNTRHGSLHERRTNCMEKLISVQRNTYSNTKLRWDRSLKTDIALFFFFFFFLQNDISDWCTSSTHSAAGVSQVTVGFWKPREPKNLRIHWTLC